MEVLPEFAGDALRDLDGFGHVWILSHLHLVQDGRWRRVVRPPLDPGALSASKRRRGVFATRSPHRPSPLGLSACRLVEVDARAGRLRKLPCC